MAITTGARRGELLGFEAGMWIWIRRWLFYLRTLRPPPRRGAEEAEVQRGERLFAEAGCAACHVPELQTRESGLAPLRHRTLALYSDLLLHDLGDALADHYPEGEATGREWRTTPLWGLGVVPFLLGGQEFYLHDGRARTLEQASSSPRRRGRPLRGALRAAGRRRPRGLPGLPPLALSWELLLTTIAEAGGGLVSANQERARVADAPDQEGPGHLGAAAQGQLAVARGAAATPLPARASSATSSRTWRGGSTPPGRRVRSSLSARPEAGTSPQATP